MPGTKTVCTGPGPAFPASFCHKSNSPAGSRDISGTSFSVAFSFFPTPRSFIRSAIIRTRSRRAAAPAARAPAVKSLKRLTGISRKRPADSSRPETRKSPSAVRTLTGTGFPGEASPAAAPSVSSDSCGVINTSSMAASW